MHCYCLGEASKDPTGFIDITFTDVNATDTTPHCKDWLITYTV